ncbi:uncharacterized protein LOC125198655 isoform X2 [Salvia hispanica]|uniref:uncharacterized protein LOC125198655 isoform X2 n=1 Tax=Salvia hispanica TaxID=49212 RepID=UPI002008FE9F|nr:uncharacterized protein LOC125198655 isoform X2 [Salvia hispanica]
MSTYSISPQIVVLKKAVGQRFAVIQIDCQQSIISYLLVILAKELWSYGIRCRRVTKEHVWCGIMLGCKSSADPQGFRYVKISVRSSSTNCASSWRSKLRCCVRSWRGKMQ